MQLSPLPMLVEEIFVKKGTSTMTQTTAISPTSPVSQLLPMPPNPTQYPQNPYLHDRK